MNKRTLKRKPVTPADAIQMLAKNGIEVNEKQAKVILDFLKYLLKAQSCNILRRI